MNSTIDYYDKNSEKYFETTKNTVIRKDIEDFLEHIKNRKELIIDLGCGSANSLKYMLDKAYNAIGVDYSKELIKLAKKYCTAGIYYKNIEDADDINFFIEEKKALHLFASASLLHLKKKSFENFIDKISFGGVFFFSLKEGSGESYDENGRFFSYYNRGEVEAFLKKRFDIIKFTKNHDIMGRNNDWISWIVKLTK